MPCYFRGQPAKHNLRSRHSALHEHIRHHGRTLHSMHQRPTRHRPQIHRGWGVGRDAHKTWAKGLWVHCYSRPRWMLGRHQYLINTILYAFKCTIILARMKYTKWIIPKSKFLSKCWLSAIRVARFHTVNSTYDRNDGGHRSASPDVDHLQDSRQLPGPRRGEVCPEEGTGCKKEFEFRAINRTFWNPQLFRFRIIRLRPRDTHRAPAHSVPFAAPMVDAATKTAMMMFT